MPARNPPPNARTTDNMATVQQERHVGPGETFRAYGTTPLLLRQAVHVEHGQESQQPRRHRIHSRASRAMRPDSRRAVVSIGGDGAESAGGPVDVGSRDVGAEVGDFARNVRVAVAGVGRIARVQFPQAVVDVDGDLDAAVGSVAEAAGAVGCVEVRDDLPDGVVGGGADYVSEVLVW